MPGRITDEQKYKLLALVKENFQVLFQLDTPAARDLQRQTWEHLATILNHLGGGVERNGKEWKNTFTQMKSTVKKKYNKVRKERRATGGGEIDPSLFLTEADHIIQEMFPASVTGISDTLELGFPDNESSDVFRAVSPISLRQSATHSNNTVGEEFRNTPVAGHSRWYDGDVGPNNSVAGHSRRNVGDVGPNPSVAGHSRRNDGDVGSNPNTPVAGHSIWYDGDVGPNTSVAGHSRRNVGDVGPNTSVAGHSRRNDGDVGSNPNTPVAGHSRWYDSDVGPNTSVAGQSRRNDGEVDQNSSESSSSSDLLQPDSTAVRQSHWNIHCSTAPSRQESIHDHSTATTATIETTGANRAMSEHSDSTGLPQSSSLPTNDLEANREHNSPPDAHERNTSGSFRRGSGPRRGGSGPRRRGTHRIQRGRGPNRGRDILGHAREERLDHESPVDPIRSRPRRTIVGAQSVDEALDLFRSHIQGFDHLLANVQNLGNIATAINQSLVNSNQVYALLTDAIRQNTQVSIQTQEILRQFFSQNPQN